MILRSPTPPDLIPRRDELHLLCTVIVAGEPVVIAGVDDVGVFRMDSSVAILVSANRIELGFINQTGVRAARDRDCGVVLLIAVDPVRKAGVHGHVVELGRRLVHISRPGLTAAVTDLGPTIIGNYHSLIILRRYPQIVMVAMRCIKCFKCFATILRAVIVYIHYINAVFILGVSINSRVIPCSLPEFSFTVNLIPVLAAVIRSKNTTFQRFNNGPNTL